MSRDGISSDAPLRRVLRDLSKLNLVILAESGQKVYRSSSFLNPEFESFHDDLFHDSEYLELIILTPLGNFLDNGTSDNSHNRRWGGFRIHRIRARLRRLWANGTARNVLKCSLTYMIASLAVYWTPFDTLLGDTDSKHVVATAAVYFHPARTLGSMHQLIIFVGMLLLYSFLVAFLGRTVAAYFFNHGEDEVSYVIDLFVSSIGLAFIAFMKQKVNKQTFNTACSLASISLIGSVVKEGSLNSLLVPLSRLLLTSEVTVVGAFVSAVMCYVAWPQRAVNNLRNGLNDCFNIMAKLLSVATHRFLNGEAFTARDLEIFSLLRKRLVDLRQALEELKYELRLRGKESEYQTYVKLVDATAALHEHLQALKSSCEMQWRLLHDNADGDSDNGSVASLSSRSVLHLSQSVENMSLVPGMLHTQNMDYTAMYLTQLFDLFVYYLAPSIKSLVFTIKEVLAEIPFESQTSTESNGWTPSRGDRTSPFVALSNFQLALSKAIGLYEQKQVKLFERLYAQDIFKPKHSSFQTNQEEVTACCGNFSSLLALFGTELIHFLELTEHFEQVSRNSSRDWKWLKFWKSKHKSQRRLDATFVEALREFKSQLTPADERTQLLGKHGENPLRRRLWRALGVFHRTDIQFGLRVGCGAFCLSSFAFMPQTKTFFVQWRLEWALVVFCIMMNKSIGGTTATVKWRFMGTFLGAFIAFVMWLISDGNGVVLALTGFLLSLPCFYIILYWKSSNAYGRFILLTYNLTALYSYSMARKESEDQNEGGDLPLVGEIAFHRFVAVSLGIVFALSFTFLFIPNSARARLKSGLTVLWLRMGVIWNSDPMEYSQTSNGVRLTGLKDYRGTRDLLIECQTLLKQAPNEFRLKGKFPKSYYEKLLSSTSTILDAFLNLQLMIEVDTRVTPTEESVLRFVENEREELEHRIFLIFYTLSSALALGFPLPSKPASTEHAKNRMLLKLSEIRSDASLKLSNEDYVLLYSYILVTSTITDELDKIVATIKVLLGDILEEIFFFV